SAYRFRAGLATFLLGWLRALARGVLASGGDVADAVALVLEDAERLPAAVLALAGRCREGHGRDVVGELGCVAGSVGGGRADQRAGRNRREGSAERAIGCGCRGAEEDRPFAVAGRVAARHGYGVGVELEHDRLRARRVDRPLDDEVA